MGLRCRFFGHEIEPGWRGSPRYLRIRHIETDGMGVEHATLETDCARCEARFTVARVHLPPRTERAINPFYAAAERLKARLKEEGGGYTFVGPAGAELAERMQDEHDYRGALCQISLIESDRSSSDSEKVTAIARIARAALLP